MAKSGGGPALSWKAFAVLFLIGLAGLWWLKTRGPEPPAPPKPRPRPGPQAVAPSEACRRAAAALRRLGVTPALTLAGEAAPGGALAVRLPRAVGFDAARQALAGCAPGVSAREEAREGGKGLETVRWRLDLEGKPLMAVSAQKSSRPALALLLDDWGYHTQGLDTVLTLPKGVSLAVFPAEAKSRAIAERAAAAGHEVLLHLPMEPSRPMKLVDGTLHSDMDDAALLALARRHMDALPQVVGVNNHEGSKGTADPRVMRQVLAACKERGLYFLDSLTNAKSVAAAEATRAGVRTAVRKVFLDNEAYDDSIEEACRKAEHLALTTGQCIAIGHPHPATIRVLARMAPEFEKRGIEIVPVSELVR